MALDTIEIGRSPANRQTPAPAMSVTMLRKTNRVFSV
jgi:hypothetical protein